MQGCYTQGKTYDEALKNIEDAIRLHVADRMISGERLRSSVQHPASGH
ncbi:MAG: type II toxin-antitoxin system HicB family antitoxin [Dehalococcoidia bacterium]